MNYILLSCIDSRIIEATKFYGRFKLGAFSSGQGLTVANSLRRALLSQLPGTAITLVKIQGASHEYDTLIGIRECVLDILLNIKQLVLKSDFEIFTPQTGFLNVRGPGIVRARDLNLPFFIYAIDPDQYIATLTSKGQLNMKFLINCGKNYLTHTPNSLYYDKWVNLLKKAKPSVTGPDIQNKTNKNINFNNFYGKWKYLREQHTQLYKVKVINHSIKEKDNQKEITSLSRLYGMPNKQLVVLKNKTEALISEHLLSISNNNQQTNSFHENQTNKIGYFPINANFTPITRVNYTIKNNEDGNSSHEIIILEIWTNGTIDPRHAIHNAAKELIELFLPLQKIQIPKQKLYSQLAPLNSDYSNQLISNQISSKNHNIKRINLNDEIKLQKGIKKKKLFNQTLKSLIPFEPFIPVTDSEKKNG